MCRPSSCIIVGDTVNERIESREWARGREVGELTARVSIPKLPSG